MDFTLGEPRTRKQYPDCDAFYSGEDLNKLTLVKATMSGAMSAGATLGLAFGPALWLALVLHAVGIEVYVSFNISPESYAAVTNAEAHQLRLTPFEHDRLRNVSYQRQVEAGMRNPGMAGLTADRLGDAIPWKPQGASESAKN